MTDVQIQLEGWLPGEQQNGLGDIAHELYDAFDKAYRLGEDTTAPTLTMIVGFVEATKISQRKNPEDKPPIVAARFIRLEVIPPGDGFDAIRAVFDEVHADRVGEDPLPLDDEGDVGGQPTS